MPMIQNISHNLADGVDRKTLKLLKKRFLEINNGRLERSKEMLPDRHRIFLDALAVLIHVNHPLLPGYVNGSTPAGISQFHPDAHHLRAVNAMLHGYEHKRDPNRACHILSLFLMGSTGSVAHSHKSDLDIWVCHKPDLSKKELIALQTKLHLIEEWADSIRLEIHFFLINPDQFREGRRNNVSGEDCGSTQHYLLLDEFYRTSLLIAGRAPLWWFIPAEHESEYDTLAKDLLHKRFIPKDEVVDLGGISDFPPGEFFGAGLWQLYKGIDSPYKSVIKILLTEVYASEFPEVAPLSLRYKQQIYQGLMDLDELDPYVLLYRKIEEYLLKNDDEPRLELVRRCFYFKVNLQVSKSRKKSRNWRMNCVKNLVSEWQWSQNKLQTLDARNRWKVRRVLEERKSIVNELNYSYRFLSRFAKENPSRVLINPQDMTLLGRKLYAAFERKSGKVELINPRIAPDLVEEFLSFHFLDSEDKSQPPYWALYQGMVQSTNRHHHEPIKRSRSIIELIAWCYFNELIDQTTRYHLHSGESYMSDHELRQIINTFFQQFPDGLPDAPQSQFEKLSRNTHVSLFINVGIDPMAEMNKQGMQRLSNFTDALRYSGLHSNLALNVDVMIVNSWNEIFNYQFNQKNAVVECLLDFLRRNPPTKTRNLPKLNIRCFCATRAAAIAKRIKELFFDVIKAFYGTENGYFGRYIMEVESHYFVIQFSGHQPKATYLKNYDALLNFLSEPQPHFSPIILDRFALEGEELPAISDHIEPNRVQIFYQRLQRDQAEVYVVDEMGSLVRYLSHFSNEQSFINHMHRFIQSTLYRQQLEQNDLQQFNQQAQIDIVFYEIIPAQINKPLHVEKRKTYRKVSTEKFYNVQAFVEETPSGNNLYTIYCDHREFTELEYGNQLYQTVADYIISMRQSKDLYPCYITDLDLTQSPIKKLSDRPLQISDYFRYKERIENQLTEALKNIRS